MLSYSAKLVYAHDLLAAQQNLYIFNVLTLFCSFLAVWQLFARCSARALAAFRRLVTHGLFF